MLLIEAAVLRAIEQFNAALALRDAEQIRVLSLRWLDVERSLQAQIDLLARDIADLQAGGGTVTASRLYQLDRYRSLLSQVQTEIGAYQGYATSTISAGQLEAIRLGLAQSTGALRAGLYAGFNALPEQAFRNMVGLCADGSPLFSVLAERAIAPEAVSGLTDALLRAVATGANPRVTARAMADGLSQGLTKALTIARTEQIRVFREAARQQYAAAGVQQYQRHCAFQDRTCIACIALDGKISRTEEIIDSHPNCRCFVTPLLPGMDNEIGGSAKTWFYRQSPEVQAKIFGSQGKYELWQSGVPLDRFATIENDPTWGPTIRQTSLAALQEAQP